MRRTMGIGAIVLLMATVACGSSTGQTGVASDLKMYLTENFSDTPWGPHVGTIQVMGDLVTVNTDLPPTGLADASGICSGVGGYIYTNDHRSLGLTRTHVLAMNGATLVSRERFADKC